MVLPQYHSINDLLVKQKLLTKCSNTCTGPLKIMSQNPLKGSFFFKEMLSGIVSYGGFARENKVQCTPRGRISYLDIIQAEQCGAFYWRGVSITENTVHFIKILLNDP